MKNGELIQEGTEAELTEKVKGHVWKCIVSEKEAECLGQRFVVSNMRSNGENIELRVISEKQPMREAELLEGTLEDAYLYETQSAGGNVKCGFIEWNCTNSITTKYLESDYLPLPHCCWLIFGLQK